MSSSAYDVPLSPRFNNLPSVEATVQTYLKNETTFLATPFNPARRTASSNSILSSGSSKSRPRSSIDSPEGVTEALTERLREPMLECFMRLVQGKSWCLGPLDAAIECVSAKFDRSLIVRVQGEAVVVFTPQSCLLQCKTGTALQKVVLELFVEMCGWKWAYIVFENDGLVLKNRNNARARYPLSAALRIEVPLPLQGLIARVKLLAIEAASLETVTRRQSRSARAAYETTAAADDNCDDELDADAVPFADANSDSDSEEESSTELDDEEGGVNSDDDEEEETAAERSPTLTSLPAPRRRRSRRRGFCRADDSRILYRILEKNSLFPSEGLLAKRELERKKTLEKIAKLDTASRSGAAGSRLKRRNSTQNGLLPVF